MTISVMTKSTRPAPISAVFPVSELSKNFWTMSAAMELPPLSSGRNSPCRSKLGEMIRTTAIVSPRARPRPSIEPPTMPPRPNGSTTERIIPHFVPPSASAPSRSPGGACAKTSRMTAVAIGITITATTVPAMNVELA